MESIKEYVCRELVTDGEFVYNTGYTLSLKGGTVVKDYYDTVLVGVIGNRISVELPDKFCGKRIVCINPIKVYKIGKELNLEKNQITVIPLKKRPKMWYTFDGTVPDDELLAEKANGIKKLLLNDTTLKRGCFKNSLLEELTFKASPSVIPEECFSGSNIKKCVLKKGVKKIGYKAFQGCSELKCINLPDSITNICQLAFYSSGIEFVRIPDGVKRIKKLSFGNCMNLKAVIIPSSVKYIHHLAFQGSPDVFLIAYNNLCAEKYAYENNIPVISFTE